jgi:hypothetical protein
VAKSSGDVDEASRSALLTYPPAIAASMARTAPPFGIALVGTESWRYLRASFIARQANAATTILNDARSVLLEAISRSIAAGQIGPVPA